MLGGIVSLLAMISQSSVRAIHFLWSSFVGRKFPSFKCIFPCESILMVVTLRHLTITNIETLRRVTTIDNQLDAVPPPRGEQPLTSYIQWAPFP